MVFLDILDAYFRGERQESLFFVVPAGIVAMAVALWLLRGDRSGFVLGFSIPCLVLGSVLLGTGLTVGLRTSDQVKGLTEQFHVSTAAMATAEGARMEAVNRNWPIYLATWVGFLVLGLGMRFGLKLEWAHGLGVALVLFGALGMVIDGFAERRALTYTRALTELAGSSLGK